MKILKQLCLVCFSIFVISSCAIHSNNISNIQGNNDLPSVIDRVRDSIVLISASVNEDPYINANQNAMCSGAVIELQYIITNFHCIYKQKFIRVYYWNDNDWNEYKVGDPKIQTLDSTKLIPLLTAALQEAITKIETLETKVAALEGS